ncbi:MAG TPA: hypothetical protein VGQ36_04495, partial [Thermoanaerobaculia bacterium]|nr:hypothetical protein [Thermoanaerobaculia bacterium]
VVGTNVYGLGTKKVFRSVVLRFSFASILSALDSGTALDFDFLEADTGLRCAVGATDTMYIAGHISDEEIRSFSWADADSVATSIDIRVSPWKYGSYSAPGPDGNNWMSRCDDRVMTGVVVNGRVAWMWTANASGGSRPWPYIRVVIIDPTTGTVIAEPDIWSPDFAYAYPDAAPSTRGVVGATMFRGGNALHPDHVVGAFDEISKAWLLTAVARGTNGPGDGLWGDYLTCRATGDGWVAAGYTLQGETTVDHVVVDVVEFGVA